MYISQSTACPYCDHIDSRTHHLFLAFLMCGQCGGSFLAPISRAFRDLRSEDITIKHAAGLLGMRMSDLKKTFAAWEAHFYPDDAQRAAAAEWRRDNAGQGDVSTIEDNIE